MYWALFYSPACLRNVSHFHPFRLDGVFCWLLRRLCLCFAIVLVLNSLSLYRWMKSIGLGFLFCFVLAVCCFVSLFKHTFIHSRIKWYAILRFKVNRQLMATIIMITQIHISICDCRLFFQFIQLPHISNTLGYIGCDRTQFGYGSSHNLWFHGCAPFSSAKWHFRLHLSPARTQQHGVSLHWFDHLYRVRVLAFFSRLRLCRILCWPQIVWFPLMDAFSCCAHCACVHRPMV